MKSRHVCSLNALNPKLKNLSKPSKAEMRYEKKVRDNFHSLRGAL
jgi:hypothetical protein